jgi:hypothetical protein
MFKRIEIDQERDLEDLVVKDPEAVEEGLKYLTHQRHANGKFIDVLAVDGDGVLVVIELKVGEEDEMLFQALEYYDWVSSNRDRLANEYKTRGKIVTEEDPRIILVASNFTDRLKKAVRYFEPRTTLMEYSYLSTKGGEKGLFCKEVINESESGFVPSVSLESALSYINPDNVKSACKKVHEEICRIGRDMEPIPRDGYIRYKCKNRVVGDISLRRTFFHVWWYKGNDEWDSAKLESLKEWNGKKAKILKAYEKQYRELGGN